MKRKVLTIVLTLILLMTMIPAATGIASAETSASAVKSAINNTKITNLASAYIFEDFFLYWDTTDCKYSIDGYKVMMSEKKDGKYTEVSDNTQKMWQQSLPCFENGKTYYYKVKGYKVYKGKTYYTKTKTIAYTAGNPMPLTFDISEIYSDTVNTKLKTDKKYNYSGTARHNYCITNPDTGDILKTFSVPIDSSGTYPVVKELFAYGRYSAYQITNGYDSWTNIIYDSIKNTVKSFASSYNTFEQVSDWMIIGKTFSGDGLGPQSISVFNADGTYEKKNLVKSNWQPYAFGFYPKRVFYAVSSESSAYMWEDKDYTIYCYDSGTGKSEKMATIKATTIKSIGYDGIKYTTGTDYNTTKTHKWTLDFDF